MKKVFFTSDPHFTHKNILYFKPERRTQAGISLEELREGDEREILRRHDDWLVEKWNATVGKEDDVYILGDICLSNRENTEKILRRLHGQKYLINGNHDKSCRGLENYFVWTGDINEVKFSHQTYPFIKEGETFCVELCHYPLLTWNRRTHGSCMAHGHCHGSTDKINEDSLELRVDVGFDSILGGLELVPLEKLYAHYRGIIAKQGMDTFQDYANWLMEKQGFRM